MKFSNISDLFGAFINDMRDVVFDDNWIFGAKVISDMHLCHNIDGVKLMVSILEKINGKFDAGENNIWKITSFNFKCDIGTVIADISFTGFGGKEANVSVYLRDNEAPVIASVHAYSNKLHDVGDYVLNSGSIGIASSASPLSNSNSNWEYTSNIPSNYDVSDTKYYGVATYKCDDNNNDVGYNIALTSVKSDDSVSILLNDK